MIAAEEIMLGQLAIARGLISLPQLLSSVEKAGATGRELPDVLMTDGYLTHSDIESIRATISNDDEAAFIEMQQGTTIVIEQFNQSVALSDTFDEAPSGFSTSVDLSLKSDERYERGGELGRGGMGEVFSAKDRVLMRDVAIKKLLPGSQDERNRKRLLLEAQVTGLLEHPSIVPVYDLLEDEKGEPYYTMRVVQEKSLAEVLEQQHNDPNAMPLTQLVSILRQVSLAVQFAHDKGVVHRDLKPENILIGKYGEVYVIDWGIAKILNTEIGLETTERGAGSLVGTPQYMAPEQARGDNDQVDGRSDVYALGAILYEILTLKPMFSADHILGLLFMVVHETPEPPSARTTRNVPQFLEEICLRAVSKDSRTRFQTANMFADELEAFLDGVKEAERKNALAAQAFEHANQVRAVYYEVRDQHKQILGEIRSLRESDDKNALWDAEQSSEDLQVEIERRFTDAVAQYDQALVHKPEHSKAHEAIAGLYWERFRDAELSGDRALAAYFEGLVRQHNDGRYDALLEGNATLVFDAKIFEHGTLKLSKFHNVRRRLVPWEVAEISATEIATGRGSYLVNFDSPEFVDLQIPVKLDRGENTTISVPLISKNLVPESFVVIPAGDFLPATNSTPEELVSVGTFAIQKLPVSVAEYLEFLNALSPEDAEPHLPQTEGVTYVQRDESGSLIIQDPDGDQWDLHWPMCIVNYFDAMAYVDWKSERDGVLYRLPSIIEWQKAARGVDGRAFPWGDHFDPSFCRMRDSEPGRPLPAPVGTYETDESPYGVRDLCGNVAEWTSTVENPEGNVRVLGGASYNTFAEMCRLDFTMTSPPQFKFGHYGFRLALDIPSFDS